MDGVRITMTERQIRGFQESIGAGVAKKNLIPPLDWWILRIEGEGLVRESSLKALSVCIQVVIVDVNICTSID